MTPVSFGSLYNVYVTKNDTDRGIYSHDNIVGFCRENKIYCKQTNNEEPSPIKGVLGLMMPSPKYEKSIGEEVYTTYTIDAPTSYDASIEAILASKGIKFTKVDPKEYTSFESVLRRIEPAQDGFVLTFIDTKKLENLGKTQNTNLENCQEDYTKHFAKKTKSLIRTGEPISPRTFCIVYEGTTEELKEKVEKYGIENLDPNTITVTSYNTGANDTNTDFYYGLKDVGLDMVPVYMDKESYKNAKVLGLVK